jgi:hypothetical protein
MKLVAINLPGGGRALTEVVEEVPDQLVSDEQPQQLDVAATREDPKERGPVGVGALLFER